MKENEKVSNTDPQGSFKSHVEAGSQLMCCFKTKGCSLKITEEMLQGTIYKCPALFPQLTFMMSRSLLAA